MQVVLLAIRANLEMRRNVHNWQKTENCQAEIFAVFGKSPSRTRRDSDSRCPIRYGTSAPENFWRQLVVIRRRHVTQQHHAVHRGLSLSCSGNRSVSIQCHLTKSDMGVPVCHNCAWIVHFTSLQGKKLSLGDNRLWLQVWWVLKGRWLDLFQRVVTDVTDVHFPPVRGWTTRTPCQLDTTPSRGFFGWFARELEVKVFF